MSQVFPGSDSDSRKKNDHPGSRPAELRVLYNSPERGVLVVGHPPAKQEITGSIPSQGTCWVARLLSDHR